jgi:hypothetical protein
MRCPRSSVRPVSPESLRGRSGLLEEPVSKTAAGRGRRIIISTSRTMKAGPPSGSLPGNRTARQAGQEARTGGAVTYAILEEFDRLSAPLRPPRRAGERGDSRQVPGLRRRPVPLHRRRGDAVTRPGDYDGRKDADGKFVQKGIHAKIDAFRSDTVSRRRRCARPQAAEARRPVEARREVHPHLSRRHRARYELDRPGRSRSRRPSRGHSSSAAAGPGATDDGPVVHRVVAQRELPPPY